MSRVEDIEKCVQALSPQELASFREWFARVDESRWDEKFEHDASVGRLNAISSAALAAHHAGKSREL